MHVLHLLNSPILIFCMSLSKIQIYFFIVKHIMSLTKNNKTLKSSQHIMNDIPINLKLLYQVFLLQNKIIKCRPYINNNSILMCLKG